jgi:hypothetical protein
MRRWVCGELLALLTASNLCGVYVCLDLSVLQCTPVFLFSATSTNSGVRWSDSVCGCCVVCLKVVSAVIITAREYAKQREREWGVRAAGYITVIKKEGEGASKNRLCGEGFYLPLSTLLLKIRSAHQPFPVLRGSLSRTTAMSTKGRAAMQSLLCSQAYRYSSPRKERRGGGGGGEG